VRVRITVAPKAFSISSRSRLIFSGMVMMHL
jgi:hypothetical protein